MFRRLAMGLVVMVIATTLAFARHGTVVTKDGKSYEGEVTETPDTYEISGVQGLAGPVGVRKSNVQSVLYPEEVAAEVRTQLGKLDRNDAKSRIEIGRVALQSHAYEAAQLALAEALAIDPNSQAALDLMAEVRRHLPATTAPTTRPTTVATTAPAHAPTTAEQAPAKRQVTAAEINRIRQLEIAPDERIRVQVDPATRRKFIASYNDISQADFNQMSAEAQARLILDKGRPELFKGVQIVSDPEIIADFKRSTSRIILQSCGSVSCHGGNKAGSFTLINPAASAAALYTNYLVLQTTNAPAKTARRPLIDRAQPENSLLLQYMLPAELTDYPHPKAANYTPVVHTKNDPRYAQLAKWLSSLPPVTPLYDIDLSKEPPPEEKPK